MEEDVVAKLLMLGKSCVNCMYGYDLPRLPDEGKFQCLSCPPAGVCESHKDLYMKTIITKSRQVGKSAMIRVTMNRRGFPNDS